MRIVGDGSRSDRIKGKRALHAALDAGFTLFDHADIYADGESERLFGEFLHEQPGLRERLCILTKCGIRVAGDSGPLAPARYDFSASYLTACVDGSLRRLGVDQIDILLLHRPDFLADFEPVAAQLDRLQSSGKVAHVGVSNFSVSQVSALQHFFPAKLLVNQVEINLHNIDALQNGVLDQCQQTGMTPQAWCPLAAIAYPAWGNTFSAEDSARLRTELERQGSAYGVADWQIGLAWLLRHPAGIAPIIGSTLPKRIAASVTALDVDYRREDWYRLLEARNGHPVA